MTRVLAISGSLRRDSYNTGLLRAAAEVAPDGVEVVVFDGLREIPPYDQDDEAAAVIGASSGMFGAVWAQQDLKRILELTGNRVLDLELRVGRAQATFEDGGLPANHELRVQLAEVIEALQDAVQQREAVAAGSTA